MQELLLGFGLHHREFDGVVDFGRLFEDLDWPMMREKARGFLEVVNIHPLCGCEHSLALSDSCHMHAQRITSWLLRNHIWCLDAIKKIQGKTNVVLGRWPPPRRIHSVILGIVQIDFQALKWVLIISC